MIPAILIGYVIGSLPIGYLVAQRVGGIDLRRAGSGNVGAANVYRTTGLTVAIVVMILDVAKGVLAVSLPGVNPVAAGVAAVAGHIYPVWLRFRGGKGVATASGVFAVLAPLPTLLAAVAFVLIVARTRFVSLGSVTAAIVLMIAGWIAPGVHAVDVGTTIVGALIVFRHRGNIARLMARTERALGT